MAKKPIDVYRDWLGIKETARPLTHYQLLRLKPFDDDVSLVRSNYRQMNAHVRKFATGEYGEESQDLLNELAKAMLCLTDSQRKREYDATLGRRDAGEGRRRTIEEILLANKVVDQDKLNKARSFAGAVGLDLHQAILQQKLAGPDVVMLAYAESLGIPYIELDDIGVDEQLPPQVPPPLARQHSCVPVMVDGGSLLMASPQPLVPDVEEELRLRFSMPVRTVLCTPAAINAAIAKYYPRDAVLMTAATGAPAKAAKGAAPAAAAKAAKGAAPAAAAAPVVVLTAEERLKRAKYAAVVGFNVTVVVFIAWKFLSLHGRPMGFGPIVLGVVLGAVVAGAAFGVMMFKK